MRERLTTCAEVMTAQRRMRLADAAGRLSALSPLAVLGRGYAIAFHGATGRALIRAGDVRPGETIVVRLHEGTLRAAVSDVEPSVPGADATSDGSGGAA
jgi:exodeoxyribonuclease VII large subunit